jgi:hypothetical protein
MAKVVFKHNRCKTLGDDPIKRVVYFDILDAEEDIIIELDVKFHIVRPTTFSVIPVKCRN